MKKLMLFILLGMFSMGIFGCAHQEKVYEEYVKTIKAVAKAQKDAGPMVKLKFTDSGGKPITLTVNQPWQKIDVQQIKDSEWAKVITTGLGYGAAFGGAWVVVDGMKSIAAMNKGNTTHFDMKTDEGGDNNLEFNDAWNTTGRDYQHGDSSQSNPITYETYKTEVETETGGDNSPVNY